MTLGSRMLKGLREALAVARGDAKPFRLTRYATCDGCLNFTAHVDGKCRDCGHRHTQPHGPTQEPRHD